MRRQGALVCVALALSVAGAERLYGTTSAYIATSVILAAAALAAWLWKPTARELSGQSTGLDGLTHQGAGQQPGHRLRRLH